MLCGSKGKVTKIKVPDKKRNEIMDQINEARKVLDLLKHFKINNEKITGMLKYDGDICDLKSRANHASSDANSNKAFKEFLLHMYIVRDVLTDSEMTFLPSVSRAQSSSPYPMPASARAKPDSHTVAQQSSIRQLTHEKGVLENQLTDTISECQLWQDRYYKIKQNTGREFEELQKKHQQSLDQAWVEATNLGKQLADIEGELNLTHSRKRYPGRDIQLEVRKCVGRNSSLNSKLNDLKSSCQENHIALADVSDHPNVKTQIQSLTRQLEESGDARVRLSKENVRMQQELGKLRLQLSSSLSSNTRIDEMPEVKEIKQEMYRLQDEHDYCVRSHQPTIDHLRGLCSEDKKTVKSLKQVISGLEDQISELEVKVTTTTPSVASMRQQRQKFEDEAGQAERRQVEQQLLISTLTSQLDGLTDEKTAIETRSGEKDYRNEQDMNKLKRAKESEGQKYVAAYDEMKRMYEELKADVTSSRRSPIPARRQSRSQSAGRTSKQTSETQRSIGPQHGAKKTGELQDQIFELQAKVQMLTESLENERKNLDQEKQLASLAEHKYQELHTGWSSDYAKLERDNIALAEKLYIDSAEMREIIQQNQKLESELEQIKTELRDGRQSKQSSVSYLQTKVNELNGIITELNRKNSALESNREESERQVREWQRRHAQLQSESDRYKREAELGEEAVEKLTLRLREATRLVDEESKKRREKTEEYDRLVTRLQQEGIDVEKNNLGLFRITTARLGANLTLGHRSSQYSSEQQLRRENKDLNAKVGQLQEDLRKANIQQDNTVYLQAKVEDLKRNNEELEIRCATAESSLAEENKFVATISKKDEEYKSLVKVLKQQGVEVYGGNAGRAPTVIVPTISAASLTQSHGRSRTSTEQQRLEQENTELQTRVTKLQEELRNVSKKLAMDRTVYLQEKVKELNKNNAELEARCAKAEISLTEEEKKFRESIKSQDDEYDSLIQLLQKEGVEVYDDATGRPRIVITRQSQGRGQTSSEQQRLEREKTALQTQVNRLQEDLRVANEKDKREKDSYEKEVHRARQQHEGKLEEVATGWSNKVRKLDEENQRLEKMRRKDGEEINSLRQKTADLEREVQQLTNEKGVKRHHDELTQSGKESD